MSAKHPGFHVVVEGPDGAGKTTIARQLVAELPGLVHRPVYYRRQPNQPFLRELLSTQKLAPRAEALVFYADRQEQEPGLLAALQAGQVVCCDRSELSSSVHQGVIRGIAADVTAMHAQAALHAPDLLVVLGAPADVLRQRLLDRAANTGRPDFEVATEFDCAAVSAAYSTGLSGALDLLPGWGSVPIALIDASRELDVVVATVVRTVYAAFKEHFS